MNSSPPSDPWQSKSSTPQDGSVEPDPDDEDTGPLDVSTPSPTDDSGTDAAQAGWAGRFDAPLTVSPRQVHRQRNPKVVLGAAVAVIAIAGGVAFWLWWPDGSDAPDAQPTTTASPATPSPDEPSDEEARLLRLLPAGYAADSCEPVDPPNDALAQVNCEKNVDPGGPLTATYTLAGDKAGLDATFNETIAAANRVDCPGNIQSPGPWRRNATLQQTSGMLFCGMNDGRPTVAWTDDDKLVVSVIHAGPSGPTLPALYAWWSSHS